MYIKWKQTEFLTLNMFLALLSTRTEIRHYKSAVRFDVKQDHCRGVYLPPSIKVEEIPFPRYSQFLIFR